MEILIVFATSLIVALLIISWRHHLRVKAILTAPLKIDGSIREGVSRFIEIEDSAIAALTAFDVIYNTLKFQPGVLGHFSSLATHPFDSLSHLISEVGSTIDQAEILPVELATNGDMSIYSPIESSALFSGQPIEAVDSTGHLSHSLLLDGPHGHALASPHDAAHAPDLHAVAFHIPIIAITIKTVRNIQRYSEGRITGSDAVIETAFDSVALSFGAIAGATLGTKVGIAFAPFTGGISLAVAPVLGSLAGLLAGGGLGRFFKIWMYGDDFRSARRKLEDAVSELRANSEELRSRFIDNFPLILRTLKERHRSNLVLARIKANEKQGLLMRLLFPTPFTKALSMAIGEMKREFRVITIPVYNSLLTQVSSMEPAEGGLLIHQQGAGFLLDIKGIVEFWEMIRRSAEAVERAKKKAEAEKKKLERRIG